MYEYYMEKLHVYHFGELLLVSIFSTVMNHDLKDDFHPSSLTSASLFCLEMVSIVTMIFLMLLTFILMQFFTLLLSRYNRTPAKFSLCYIFTFTQISKELDRFSLTSEVKQAILDCVWPRQEEVRQMLVFNAASISNSYLKDFDWKVKVHATFDYT